MLAPLEKSPGQRAIEAAYAVMDARIATPEFQSYRRRVHQREREAQERARADAMSDMHALGAFLGLGAQMVEGGK